MFLFLTWGCTSASTVKTVLIVLLLAATLGEAKLYHAVPPENLERARRVICEISRDFDDASSEGYWGSSCCFPVSKHSYAAAGVFRGVPLDDAQRSFAHWRTVLAQNGKFSIYYASDREGGGNSHFCLERRQLSDIYRYLKCDDDLSITTQRGGLY